MSQRCELNATRGYQHVKLHHVNIFGKINLTKFLVNFSLRIQPSFKNDLQRPWRWSLLHLFHERWNLSIRRWTRPQNGGMGSCPVSNWQGGQSWCFLIYYCFLESFFLGYRLCLILLYVKWNFFKDFILICFITVGEKHFIF